MYAIKRVRDDSKLDEFVVEFCKQISYRVPLQFFEDEEVWGLYKDGKLVGGFALISKKPLRSLEQIPNASWESLWDTDYFCEFTGYWIDDKKLGVPFTIWLVIRSLLRKESYFVYSYPVSDTKLERYYSYGKPIKIYKGEPQKLEGHTSFMEPEFVEILTKLGIVRIFWYRTKKVLKRMFGVSG